jgi:hypothetical protein
MIGRAGGFGHGLDPIPLVHRGRSGRRSDAALLGLAVGTFLLLTACTPATELEVGDCFDGASEGETVVSVTPVECDKPHDKEVFAVFDYPSSPSDYPGDDAILAEAEEGCIPAFGSYVGKDFEASTLEVLYLTPTTDTWRQGDKEITCTLLAPNPGEKLTGSMRGSGR